MASLAIGIGALFANVVVGGLFLLAAPTLATLGRERGERALRRKRAAESAMKAVQDAVRDLGTELERVKIDDFARGIAPSVPAPPAFVQSSRRCPPTESGWIDGRAYRPSST